MNPACPSDSELGDYVGADESEVPEEVLDHVLGCDECRQTMRSLKRQLDGASDLALDGFDPDGAVVPFGKPTRRAKYQHIIAVAALAATVLLVVSPKINGPIHRGREGALNRGPGVALTLHTDADRMVEGEAETVTDRSPLRQRVAVVQCLSDAQIRIYRVGLDSARSVVTTAQSPWLKPSHASHVAWFPAVPAESVDVEWFMALRIDSDADENEQHAAWNAFVDTALKAFTSDTQFSDQSLRSTLQSEVPGQYEGAIGLAKWRVIDGF